MQILAYSSIRIQQSLHTVILKHIEEVNPSIRTFRLTIPPSVGSIKVSPLHNFFFGGSASWETATSVKKQASPPRTNPATPHNLPSKPGTLREPRLTYQSATKSSSQASG